MSDSIAKLRASLSSGDLTSFRRAFHEALADPGLSGAPCVFGGTPGEIFSPQDKEFAGDSRTIVYFHGGGYVSGSVATHRRLCRDISTATGMSVISADYRLAPEFPFPVAIHDSLSFLTAILDSGQNRPVLVAGDSAGAGLAVAAALHPACLDRVSALLCLSPWVDLRPRPLSDAEEVDIFGSAVLNRMSRLYAGDSSGDPLASPILHSFSGCPPTLVLSSTTDPLLEDALALGACVARAKRPVHLLVLDNEPHDWMLLTPGSRAVLHGLRVLSEFVRHASN